MRFTRAMLDGHAEFDVDGLIEELERQVQQQLTTMPLLAVEWAMS